MRKGASQSQTCGPDPCQAVERCIGGPASTGGIFQLQRDVQSIPEAHLALYFGPIVGVSLRGHHEAVTVYPHVAGVEREPNLCWGHRWVQIGPCAGRAVPTRGPLAPLWGSLPVDRCQDPKAGTGRCRLTAALGAAVAHIAEAGTLLLPELPVEALPAAPHCRQEGVLAGEGAPQPLSAPPSLRSALGHQPCTHVR